MESQELSTVPSLLRPGLSRRGLLPQEILGEFAEYLAGENHRKDLLNVSLASKRLRTEAQRVLFRALDYPGPGKPTGQWEQLVTHCLFLRAVINSPMRLALHVRTYTSRFLALPPADSDEHDEQSLFQSDEMPYRIVSCKLWNFTSRALPLLTQLKHLTLFLATDCSYMLNGSESPPFCGTSILRRCNFTLDSFAWADGHGLLNTVADLEEFLSRQTRLHTLNLKSILTGQQCTDQAPRFHFASNTLPCLQRIMGPPFLLLALLSERRHINALSLSWLPPGRHENLMVSDEVKKALQGVKYLSLANTSTLNLQGISPSLSSVETLYLKRIPISWVRLFYLQRSCCKHLDGADIPSFPQHHDNDMSALTHLKSLRILILEISRFDLAYQISPDNSIELIASRAFDGCSRTLDSVHFLLPMTCTSRYQVFSLGDNGQLQMDNTLDLISNIMTLLEPWIPQQQPLWRHLEDYF